MKFELDILPPTMPNFITFDMPAVTKGEPLDFDRGKMPIEQLTRPQAEAYAELMKQTFLKHWENKGGK